MTYIDAHCHLGSRQFSADREEVIHRMDICDVGKVIMICCGRHDLGNALPLRDTHPGFKLAVGIHPQDMEGTEPDRIDRLRQVINDHHPDMIGEIGLDYYSHKHTREKQQDFFIRQLQLAQEYDLPVDIHCRRATGDTLQILKENPVRGIMHSYSGSAETAEILVRMGYYIAFGASILFKGARRPAEAIKAVPLDRLLIETDAPYQSPVLDHRHEPADVIRIYEAVSRVKEIPLEELERIVEENFDRVFANHQ